MRRSLAIFALAGLASLEYWSLYLSMDDEAVVVYGSQRLLQGEWLYRDWDTHLSPGAFLLGALWFGLWGFQAPATRCLFALIFALTAVVIDQVAQRTLPARWQGLPTLLWLTGGVMEFPILSYHWMASGAACLCLWRGLLWLEHPGRYQALTLGASVALAGWLLQSEGIVALLMVALWWLRFRPANLHWLVLGLVAASLLLWAPVLPQLPEFVARNLQLGQHLSFNRKPYSWSNLQFFLDHYQGLSPQLGWATFLAASSHLGLNAFRYLSFPLLVALSWGLSERQRDRAGVALSLGVLAWLLGTANRHTVLYLSFLNPGWCLLLGKSLQLLPRGTVLAVALAGLECLGWLSRGWFRQQHFIYPVNTRIGLFYSQDPGEAAGQQELWSWLRAIPPGSPMLAFPYATRYYSLGQFRNPSRQQTLLPLLDPPQVLAATQQTLKEQRVEWLLYIGPDAAEIEGELGIPAPKVTQEWQKLRDQLTQGYQQVEGGPQAGLYRRIP